MNKYSSSELSPAIPEYFKSKCINPVYVDGNHISLYEVGKPDFYIVEASS